MDAAAEHAAAASGAGLPSRPQPRGWQFVLAGVIAAVLMWATQGLPALLQFRQVPEIANIAWTAPVWVAAAVVFGIAVGVILWWGSRTERGWAGYGLTALGSLLAYLAALFVGLLLAGLDAGEAFLTAFVFGGLVGGAWGGIVIVLALARWVRPAGYGAPRDWA